MVGVKVESTNAYHIRHLDNCEETIIVTVGVLPELETVVLLSRMLSNMLSSSCS